MLATELRLLLTVLLLDKGRGSVVVVLGRGVSGGSALDEAVLRDSTSLPVIAMGVGETGRASSTSRGVSSSSFSFLPFFVGKHKQQNMFLSVSIKLPTDLHRPVPVAETNGLDREELPVGSA